jgi:hypothetical protein
MKMVGVLAFIGLAYVAVSFALQISFPRSWLTTYNLDPKVFDGHLFFRSFDLRNDAWLTLKDFEVACDMNAPSGTTLKTLSKIYYDALPAGANLHIPLEDLGPVVDQSVSYNCYLKSAKVKW